MKGWTGRPEKTVCRRKRDLEAFLEAYLRETIRMAIKQGIMLRCIVAEVRHLLILSVAVAAKDKSFTRIVVPTFVRIDRLFAARRVVRAHNRVRSKFGKKDDQKERRQKACLALFFYQC